MALPASDVFTDTDGVQLDTHNAGWSGTYIGYWLIYSNSARMNANSEHAAYWNADTFDNNQYSQATLPALSTDLYVGVAARKSLDTAKTYYAFYTDGSGGQTILFKNVASTVTQLGSAGSQAWSTNDTIRIEVSGASPNITVTPYRNGSVYSSIGAQSDSSLASGAAGLAAWGSTTAARMDDWEGGNLSGPPALDQEGYRWRNDNGSETTATWLAAQDTAITQPVSTNTRLRMIVNATNDPVSKKFKLQYRKQGVPSWRDVP